MGIIKKEGIEIKEIWRRIRKKDFSGNEGLAVKNSIYQFSTNLVAKAGSFIITIILARLLMPELFGLYNLALSTILLFYAVSNLGVGETLVRFVSRELGRKNKRKAKEYVFYLGKLRLILIFIAGLFLIFSARFISENYYQKPLFLALIAGSLYILFVGLVSFLESVLQSVNYFKGIFQKEIIFQISRIILVPLAVLLALKGSLSGEKILFLIIMMLSLSYLLTFLFISTVSRKKVDFIKTKRSALTQNQARRTRKFLFITAAFVFSGFFFGSIDKIILGRFVASEFIGYYSAAFNLVAAIPPFLGFGVVLFPIFSRLKRKSLARGLKKSVRITLALSFILFLLTLILSHWAILIIFGEAYLIATNLLRLLSALILVSPLIGIYTVYFMSRGKPQIVAKLLIFSTIINILLNYILITSFLRYGELAAVFGAGIATVISQFFYLSGLVIMKKKEKI